MARNGRKIGNCYCHLFLFRVYSENAQSLRIRIPKRRCYKERINLLGCLLVASKTNVLGGMASVIFEFDVRTTRGSPERENSSLYYILPNCPVDNS